MDGYARIFLVSFLVAPVVRYELEVDLGSPVACLRSHVACGAGLAHDEVVLGAGRVLGDDGLSLEAAGVAEGGTVVATRRVGGGGGTRSSPSSSGPEPKKDDDRAEGGFGVTTGPSRSSAGQP